MKCPLTFKTSDDNNGADCIEEKCEWWSSDRHQCDPTGLVLWVKCIAETLVDISNKMPKHR